MPVVRIATRASALAMWQASHVRDLLVNLHADLEVELLPIVTRGDRIIDRPLTEIGGKGLFLKELEIALLKGEADIAVHSMKDVPAEFEPGLGLGVVLARATPWDAWVCAHDCGPAELAPGSRVGTSSLRRRSQLMAKWPHLEVADLRGNVDTRISKLDKGEYDAVILAQAGLERLDLAGRVTSELAAPTWLPAPAQGAIGIECRAGDENIKRLLLPLNHEDTALTTAMERHVAAALGGSCQVPLAAFAFVEGESVQMQALVSTPDGDRTLRSENSGSRQEAAGVAEAIASDLLVQGAGEIIAALTS